VPIGDRVGSVAEKEYFDAGELLVALEQTRRRLAVQPSPVIDRSSFNVRRVAVILATATLRVSELSPRRQ